MDFPWIPPTNPAALTYQHAHFSQCTLIPAICPPLTASCATNLCNHCPRVYHTCCQQTTALYTDCFSSVSEARQGYMPVYVTVDGTASITTATMSGGGAAATTTSGGAVATTTGGAAATSGGGASGSSGSVSEGGETSVTTPVTTAAPVTTGTFAQSAVGTTSSVKTGVVGKEGVKAGLLVGMCVVAGVLTM